MRKLLIALIFGADEIAQRMGAMLTLRRLALKRHVQNNKVAAQLRVSRLLVDQHVANYHANREALEQAYKLELK